MATYALLKFGDDTFATLECITLGFVQASLKILDLLFETFAKSFDLNGMLLFLAQFFGKACSVGS